MIDEIARLVNSYVSWLRDKTALRALNDWVEITTPHLDRHNDYLQIYVGKEGDHYLLTDDGYVIEDLIQSGCNLDSSKRQQLLSMTLNGFGIQREENRLIANATETNFSARKHDLLQAMIAVNDLFYLAAPMVASLFYEDVLAWLDDAKIRYTPSARIGKSGFEHTIDFVIPKSQRYPERFLEAVNRPAKQNATSAVFKLNDIREIRPVETQMYVILNDKGEVPVSEDVLSAFKRYELNPILWSQRQEYADQLAS
jgi:hypothetical protein